MSDEQTAREKIAERTALQNEADEYRQKLTDPNLSDEERNLYTEGLLEVEAVLETQPPGLGDQDTAAERTREIAQQALDKANLDASKAEQRLKKDMEDFERRVPVLNAEEEAVGRRVLAERQQEIDASRLAAKEQQERVESTIKSCYASSAD